MRSYLPDFRVLEKDGTYTYYEVKGWMDSKSVTKIRRMKKYHPHVRLVLVTKATFDYLNRVVAPMVEGWESASSTIL